MYMDTELKHEVVSEEGLRLQEKIKASLVSLTPREREVLNLVLKGLMNKQIAYELNISVIMVKTHRGRMMKKMGSRSIVDLIRKYDFMKLYGIWYF